MGSVLRERKEIRERILAARDRMPADVRHRKDIDIRRRLMSLPEFLTAQAILLYASFRSEVDTMTLMPEVLAMGKRVFLPKVDQDNARLVLYEIEEMGELTPGFMGIYEPGPTRSRPAAIGDADLVIVPGAVFDLKGNRLGYGVGYYDRLLSQRRGKGAVAGLAYEEQVVELVPAEAHDVKMDIIVTDERIIRV